MVKYLVKHGADVNANTILGHLTPLMVALIEGNINAVDVLIEAAENQPEE